MVTSEQVGKVVRYYKAGWHTGKLLSIQPRKKLAVIEHPVLARKQKVLLENVDPMEEK